MSEKNPDIGRLDYAIASLNDDAESMHALITRSTEELERATEEGKRAVDIADETLKSIVPLAEGFQSAIDDSRKLMADTTKAVDKLAAEVEQAHDADRKAFDSFAAASLRASEKTRDDLQTDLLSHKTATAARLDSFEGTVIKRVDGMENAIASTGEKMAALEKSIDEKFDSTQKKIALPLYGVIAVAALQIVTLIVMFIK